MKKPLRAVIAVIVVGASLVGCKRLFNKGEETSAEPSATLAATPPPAPSPTEPATATPVPTTPGRPAQVTPRADAGAGDAGTGARDAGADAAAPAADAGARTDAGSPSQRAQACFDRCATVLQGCLTPRPDGGAPIANITACRAAADQCRAGCQ
jgi:hypothetical protein